MDKSAPKPRYTLQSSKPVAFDSPDHIQPHGTRWDNSRNRLFNGKMFALFPGKTISVLDFGCSGGGFIKSCIDAGHNGLGLEGSDYSKRSARAEWATIPENLFTTDVTADWQAFADSAPAKFEIITAWEFIEHIKPADLPKVCAGALRHLKPGGLWIMSVSTDREVINGHVLHQTVENRQWWIEFFASQGLKHHEQFVSYFGQDWVRGPLQNAPGSFHLVLAPASEAPPALPNQFKHPLVDLVQNAADFFNAGVSGNCRGMIEYALLSIDQALTEAPTHPEMHFARANILLKLGRAADALAELQTVLKLSPGHPQASHLLSQLTAPSQIQRPAAAPTIALRPVQIPAQSAASPRQPKISVVTPSYNCAQYLPQCIQSVLAQGYDNIEHIIVDGASKDGTVEILKQYPHVKWISEPDRGEAEALNKALKMATGDIITWLNADDYYVSKHVYKAVFETQRAHPDADVFFGNTLIIDDDENILEMRVPRVPLDINRFVQWFQDVRLFQPSIFYTRKVADAIGAYREDLYYAIDLEYWLRMTKAGFKFQHIDQTLSKSRLKRPGAKSGGSPEDQQKAYYEICTSFVRELPSGQAFDFWKEYYRLRILTQHLHKAPIPVGETFEATSALCFALLQLNQIQQAISVAEALIARHPNRPESYWFASEALHKAGRPDQARNIAGRAMEHVPGGAIAPLPRAKNLPFAIPLAA